MRKVIAILLIAALAINTSCWETECLAKILTQMADTVSSDDVTKADDGLVALYQKGDAIDQIYDTHTHYNTDYKDRIGEDTSVEAFTKAEIDIGLAFISRSASSTAADLKASTKLYYYGVCCYFFNPCIAIKLGMHFTIPITAEQEKLDEEVFIASAVKAKNGMLASVIKSKDQKSQDKQQIQSA